MSAPTCVALIPARAGSKRVPDKNVRVLAGHPTLAYTISAALESGVFQSVVVSTDSERYGDIALHYGAEVVQRPGELAGDTSPDIDWVEHALKHLGEKGRRFDTFGLLRPTSPFRLATTIQRAWGEFISSPGVDSLRAVEKCKQHPGKMWVIDGKRMLPLLPLGAAQPVPWHSSQYQALPPVYVQNASLEIAWTRVVTEGRTIAGQVLIPFLTERHEGFDVNHPVDWQFAEEYVRTGEASLPSIRKEPYR